MRPRSFASASARRFLLAALLPILAVGLLTGFALTRTQRDAVDLRNSLAASTVEAQVESFLAAPSVALGQLAHIASDDRPHKVLPQAMADHIESVESVLIIGADGRVVEAGIAPGTLARSADLVGLDRGKDPLFVRAKQSGALTWSDVFTSTISGGRVIGLAAPVKDQVAEATIDIEELGRFVENANLEEGTTVVVTDSAGNVLFHTDQEVARLRPNWNQVEPIAQGIKGRTGRYEYELDGVRMLGSTASVDGPNWTVLVQQERSVAMRPVTAVWSGVALVVVIVAIVAVFAAVVFSRGLSQPVADLSRVASAVERGDYTNEVADLRFVELNNLSRTITSMAEAVRDRESDLLDSHRRLAEEAAEKSEALARLSAMSAELTAAEERERRRLAEELHDRVSQVLAVARMRLGMASGTNNNPDRAELERVSRLLAEAVAQTRAITSELAPPVLYELGLGAAIVDCCTGISEQHGLDVHVATSDGVECLSEDAKMAMLRAARELVMNVVKHAHTDQAWVDLDLEDDFAVLRVRDEGSGIDPDAAAPEGGFGLFSIRERLLHLGGAIEVDSKPGLGTTVTVRIPCRVAARPATETR